MWTILIMFHLLLFIDCLLFIGCVKVESHLNKRYAEVLQHYKTDSVTMKDKALMQATYRGGALMYMPIAPYASRILRRCINGNSRTLYLHSRYIKHNSPTIKVQRNTEGTSAQSRWNLSIQWI
jgi:hypothetical protein